MKSAIIICNGSPISKSILNTIKVKYDCDVLCADGGSSIAFKYKVLPKFIIGDLDSSDKRILNYFRKKGTKIIQLNRQSDTDLEKTLKFCKKHRYERLFIVGFAGKRFDHTISNISNSLKFAGYFKILMIDNNSSIYLISGKKEFRSYNGELISIYSFSPTAKITTSNLKYPLRNETLMFGERESTSNVSTKEKFSVIVKEGFAILVRSTKNFLQYD